MSKSVLSVQDLERILDERKTKLQQLAKQRDELQKELDTIDAEINQLIGDNRGLGSIGRSRKRRRPKNDRSLRSVVLEVLKASKPGFTLADLAGKVSETGYKSTSRNFRNVLYQCLYNTAEIIHDGSTGRYKLAK